MPTIDPDGLKQVADGFETQVAATLDRARITLSGGPAQEILSGNFTNVHIALATVYVEAYNFAVRDLQRKAEDAGDFKARLVKTADDWVAAEGHSIVQGH